MRRLYLVRHGEAESYANARSDSERKLTENGKNELTKGGATLRTIGVLPSVIICSTYKRAHETADILAKAIGFNAALYQDARLAPSCTISNIVSLLGEFRQHDEIMLVSHNPIITELASFIVGSKSLAFNFETGTSSCFTLNNLTPPIGALDWFLPLEISTKLGNYY